MAGSAGLKVIEAKFYKDTRCNLLSSSNFYTHACDLTHTHIHTHSHTHSHAHTHPPHTHIHTPTHSYSHTHTHTAGFWGRWFTYPLSLLSSTLTHLPTLTLRLWPYLTVVFAFLTFVVKNGSIVVGDKSHHQASFHIPQLFYFIVFACAMAAPHFVFNLRLVFGFLKVLLTKRRWMMGSVCLLGLVFMAVHRYT